MIFFISASIPLQVDCIALEFIRIRQDNWDDSGAFSFLGLTVPT